MASSFRSYLAVLTSCVFLALPAFAFQSPLSDQAVREAYFLGQRHDEFMARLLNRYTRFLPAPPTGPHIYSVSFLTPFALLVKYSSRQLEYSAQRAALDHKSREEVVEISIEILLTQSYGPVITTPTSSRSGSPLGYQLRPSDFWRSFKFHIFDGVEEITTEDLTGEPSYLCAYKGGCQLTGAIVHFQFPATAFTSDSATIEVTPPEGDPVSVDFDLTRLR